MNEVSVQSITTSTVTTEGSSRTDNFFRSYIASQCACSSSSNKEINRRNRSIDCRFNLVLFCEDVEFITINIHHGTSFHGQCELRRTCNVFRHNLIKYGVHQDVFMHRKSHTDYRVISTKCSGFLLDLCYVVFEQCFHVVNMFSYSISALESRIILIEGAFYERLLHFVFSKIACEEFARISEDIIARFLMNTSCNVKELFCNSMHRIGCISAEIEFLVIN